MPTKSLKSALGNIDIYLLDQILKGRYLPHHKILDAGCGQGRNLHYFMQNGFDVWAVDRNENNLSTLLKQAKPIFGEETSQRFVLGTVEALPYSDAEFDRVICNAVLHFAENEPLFFQMFTELFRILKPQGQLFIRTCSDFGIEGKSITLGNGRYQLPDGSTRFLLDRQILEKLKKDFRFTWIEPLKTVNVNNLRCMTTLVLAKKI